MNNGDSKLLFQYQLQFYFQQRKPCCLLPLTMQHGNRELVNTVGTLEEDIVDIIFGNPPTPNYADWKQGEIVNH
jgi:hypothetical protein